MRSWRHDRRFHCPYCNKTIRIVIASPNSVSLSDNVVAVCLSCQRFFEKQEWRYQSLPKHYGMPEDEEFPF